ncbi:hypothetical protein ABH307_00650 [Acinetobacter pittii]|uniref:hypothetical protein n=1 Tax=Acinetobacter pittii TaxID=48296 RepID=UPI0032606D9B
MGDSQNVGINGGLSASQRKAKEREFYRSNGFELAQVWIEPENLKLLDAMRGRGFEKKPKNKQLDNRVLINTVLTLLDSKVLKRLAEEAEAKNKPIEKVIKEYVKKEAENRKFNKDD